MAWRRIGDKPLSEPMLTRFAYTYMRHWGGVSGQNGWDDGMSWGNFRDGKFWLDHDSGVRVRVCVRVRMSEI